MSPVHAISSRLLDRTARTLQRLQERLGNASRTARYLREGLLEFSVRPDDTFIVSYPRSGTTWMQLILHELTSDGDRHFEHISQVIPWFERSLAVGALTARDLEALPSPRCFKSHLPYGWLPRGGRIIHLVREVRDVALSYYHFYCSHLRFTGTLEEFLERFLRGEVQYKSWFKHTAGWQAQRGDPRILFLRYEDLRHSLATWLPVIARFCGLSLPSERIPGILERGSFAAMKRDEDKFDFATEFLLQRGYRRGVFLRRGQVGDGARVLSAGQEEALASETQRARRLTTLELDLPQFLH